jgi:hypothetical protein
MSIRESKWRQITKITIIKPNFGSAILNNQSVDFSAAFILVQTTHADNITYLRAKKARTSNLSVSSLPPFVSVSKEDQFFQI